jgi:crossover junction endodeoxyribonuclease RusA
MRVMNTDPITITMPLPPPELNPNGRHHWRAKLRPKAKYRDRAQLEGLAAMGGRMAPRWLRPRITLNVYHKTKAFRDPDNIIASCKAAIDGLTECGILNDDRDCVYAVNRAKDAANPRIEITIEPAPRHAALDELVAEGQARGEYGTETQP